MAEPAEATLQRSGPRRRRRDLRRLFLALAALWTALVGWRAWTTWPHLPLDSAGDPATAAALNAAAMSHLTKAAVIGLAGVALFLGLAALNRSRRPPSPFLEQNSGPWTGPARILLMRHAEKTGDMTDFHLSAAGKARAQKLTDYIPRTFGKPDAIFAAARSRRSTRSIETVEPLAASLGLAIQDHIEDQDYAELAELLANDGSYQGALVVISWQHGKLPELAEALGAPPGSYPDPWPEETFNLIIDLDYGKGLPPSVRQIVEPF